MFLRCKKRKDDVLISRCITSHRRRITVLQLKFPSVKCFMTVPPPTYLSRDLENIQRQAMHALELTIPSRILRIYYQPSTLPPL